MTKLNLMNKKIMGMTHFHYKHACETTDEGASALLGALVAKRNNAVKF